MVDPDKICKINTSVDKLLEKEEVKKALETFRDNPAGLTQREILYSIYFLTDLASLKIDEVTKDLGPQETVRLHGIYQRIVTLSMQGGEILDKYS